MAEVKPLEIIATVSYVAVTEELVEALGRYLYDGGNDDPDCSWEDDCTINKEYWYSQARKAIAFMQLRGSPDWCMGTANAAAITR